MQFLKNFLKSLGDNLKRKPLAIISAYLATGLIIFLIAKRGGSDYIIKGAATFVLAYFLFTALYFCKKRLVLLIGAIFLGLYYYFYASYFDNAFFIYQTIYLDIASFFMLFWVPFIYKNESNLYFYNWFKGIIYSFIASFFISILIIIGIFLAYGAIDKLLGLDLGSKIYGYSATAVFGIFGANYFLYLLDSIELDGKIDKIELLISKYILPIFTVGYFLILYLYTAKIIIYNAWPKGYLAWFIVVFTLIAFLSYLFLTPYKSTKWRKLFLATVIPQAIMLLLAVYKRVQNYSFTEQRYMLVVYALFLIATSLYFLIRKDAKYKYLFMAITFILVLLQIGPASSWYIAKKAQEARLVKALNSYKIHKNKDLEYTISDTVDYLTQRYGIDGVKNVLGDIVDEYKKDGKDRFDYSAKKYITKKIGFRYLYQYERKHIVKKYITNDYSYYNNIKGYNWYVKGGYDIYNYIGKNKIIEIKKIDITIYCKGNILFFKKGNNEYKIDLTPQIKKIYKTEDKKYLIYKYKDNKIKLKIIFHHISLEESRIINTEFSLFFSLF